mmetsp:Transcript_56957/g.135812  ORF Transcript_56957/g.135812 Transcript_56957/m.135812 type:complete len:303 (+) Transcript_56957:1009-1917(+)
MHGPHLLAHRLQLHLGGRHARHAQRGEGEEVTGDLVLDEELHEVLRQLDLFGEAFLRQIQQALQLRLDLHHDDAEQGTLQLHCPEGFGKPLLLWGQRLDGILELLRSWDGRQIQGDLQLVLVLQQHRVFGLKAGGGGHVAQEHDEGTELPRPSHQRKLGTGVAGELMAQISVQLRLPREGDLGGRVQRNLHLHFPAAAAGADRLDGLSHFLDPQAALGVMVLGAADWAAEGLWGKGLPEEPPVMEPHVGRKVHGRHLLANCSHQLLPQHGLDVGEHLQPLLHDVEAVEVAQQDVGLQAAEAF